MTFPWRSHSVIISAFYVLEESLIPTTLKGVGIRFQLTRGEYQRLCGLILKSPQHGNHAAFILWDTIIIQGLGSLADGG